MITVAATLLVMMTAFWRLLSMVAIVVAATATTATLRSVSRWIGRRRIGIGSVDQVHRNAYGEQRENGNKRCHYLSRVVLKTQIR
jgi:hypothetical protein